MDILYELIVSMDILYELIVSRDILYQLIVARDILYQLILSGLFVYVILTCFFNWIRLNYFPLPDTRIELTNSKGYML